MSEVVDSNEKSNYSSDSDEEYFVTSVFNHRTKKKRKIGQPLKLWEKLSIVIKKSRQSDAF